MDILYLLIPLSVVLAIVIGAAFWMAVDGGQFDDLEAPALRILADDDRPHPDRTCARRCTSRAIAVTWRLDVHQTGHAIHRGHCKGLDP